MKKSYDVVVIGAGNGGLAAACKVLKEGRACLICERHNIPGGFATSFVRGRFEFEASLHELNSVGPDPINHPGTLAKTFQDLGVFDKIDFIQISNCYRLISVDDKIDFTMPIGIENIIKATKDLCIDAEKHVRRFIAICKNCADAMTYFGQCHGKPDPEVLKTTYLDYMMFGEYSFNQVYDAIHFPEILRKIFNGYWSYLGSPGNEMCMAHYGNMIYKYFVNGAVVPLRRSHEMSLALEMRIRELGGDFFFNTEVTKILLDDKGHVNGVRLANGEEISTRHVIANVSPHFIYSRLIDNVPERALKLTNYRKFGARGITVFLGLNKSPEELGITDHSYFVYQNSDTIDTFKKMGDLIHTAGQATVCLNHVVPNASPKGTTILYMTTLCTTDAWSKVKEEDYFKVKNKMAKALIKQFEDNVHVNLHDHIEEIAVATPETYARYCGHPQGVIYSYRSQVTDNLMARVQMINDDAIIPGLRIGGGSGERSSGFSSAYVSGYNEAKRTLNDIKEGR